MEPALELEEDFLEESENKILSLGYLSPQEEIEYEMALFDEYFGERYE